MQIFQSEIDDGLKDKILANTSIAYCSEINSLGSRKLSDFVTAGELALLQPGLNNKLLYPLYTILATTCWNGNSDVFVGEEMWAARKTPEHTPFNFGHRENDIIGNITSDIPVDDELNLIAEDTKVEDLPETFHLLTSAVIYKHWKDDASRERIAEIIEDIKDGKYFVSMEAVVSNYDYALKSPEGKEYIVARDNKTSFLSKYLKCYGGKGVYEDYTLGRVLRDICFSGKGLVSTPANPSSVIFNDVSKFSGLLTTASILEKPKIVIKEIKVAEDNKFEADLSVAKAELVKLGAERDGLVKDKTSLETAVANLTKEKSDLSDTVKGLEKSLSDVKEKNVTLEASLKTSSEELAKISLEVTKAERVSKFVEAGKTKEEAEKLATKFLTIASEQFDEIVALAKVKAPEKAPEVTASDEDAGEDVVDSAEVTTEAALSTSEDEGEQVEAEMKEVVEFLSRNRKARK